MILYTGVFDASNTDKSDEEIKRDVHDLLVDRESWQWQDGWTLELLVKNGDFHTFVVKGEWDEL